MSSSKLPFHLHPLDFELQSATLEDLSSEQLALIQFHPFCTEELRGQAEVLFWRRRNRDLHLLEDGSLEDRTSSPSLCKSCLAQSASLSPKKAIHSKDAGVQTDEAEPEDLIESQTRVSQYTPEEKGKSRAVESFAAGEDEADDAMEDDSDTLESGEVRDNHESVQSTMDLGATALNGALSESENGEQGLYGEENELPDAASTNGAPVPPESIAISSSAAQSRGASLSLQPGLPLVKAEPEDDELPAEPSAEDQQRANKTAESPLAYTEEGEVPPTPDVSSRAATEVSLGLADTLHTVPTEANEQPAVETSHVPPAAEGEVGTVAVKQEEAEDQAMSSAVPEVETPAAKKDDSGHRARSTSRDRSRRRDKSRDRRSDRRRDYSRDRHSDRERHRDRRERDPHKSRHRSRSRDGRHSSYHRSSNKRKRSRSRGNSRSRQRYSRGKESSRRAERTRHGDRHHHSSRRRRYSTASSTSEDSESSYTSSTRSTSYSSSSSASSYRARHSKRKRSYRPSSSSKHRTSARSHSRGRPSGVKPTSSSRRRDTDLPRSVLLSPPRPIRNNFEFPASKDPNALENVLRASAPAVAGQPEQGQRRRSVSIKGRHERESTAAAAERIRQHGYDAGAYVPQGASAAKQQGYANALPADIFQDSFGGGKGGVINLGGIQLYTEPLPSQPIRQSAPARSSYYTQPMQQQDPPYGGPSHGGTRNGRGRDGGNIDGQSSGRGGRPNYPNQPHRPPNQSHQPPPPSRDLPPRPSQASQPKQPSGRDGGGDFWTPQQEGGHRRPPPNPPRELEDYRAPARRDEPYQHPQQQRQQHSSQQRDKSRSRAPPRYNREETMAMARMTMPDGTRR